MPRVGANGIDIYYEEHGEGEPLLLIMGWGGNAASWLPQVPGLAERFRVITFDNRGVGRTDAPDGPYSVRNMARDAAGLLDTLGIEKAHVMGISMGGMIAQALAIEHPERVDALVLGCTSPGGNQSAGFDELRENIDSFYESTEQDSLNLGWFMEFMRMLWTEGALARAETHLQDFVLSLIRYPPTTHGLQHQATAVSEHDVYEQLSHIEQPTLVITGDDDPLIHPDNSTILAERIPRAELQVFAGLKHAFHLERPDLVNPMIIDFIHEATRSNGVVRPASRPKAKRRTKKTAT